MMTKFYLITVIEFNLSFLFQLSSNHREGTIFIFKQVLKQPMNSRPVLWGSSVQSPSATQNFFCPLPDAYDMVHIPSFTFHH